MRYRKALTALATHDVTNQPPPLGPVNLFESDAALRGAVEAGGGAAHHSRLAEFGERCGALQTREWARQANENPPRLKSFDRYGRRLDEVDFHPAYHRLMALGLSNGISGCAWSGEPAGHVLHGAMMFLMTQADAGVTCPMSMTYASIAALKAAPELANVWAPRVAARAYDRRSVPAAEKKAATIGMAMTEKQGGSDVRGNTTRAEPASGGGYTLTGHKWFCSAPMSDAFLTLAQAPAGLTCFLAPRWRPDGERNAIRLMRLKDKLGDRSNASAEIEYHGAWAQRVGGEGRGVPTIIGMVQLTRYDCALGSAAGMRAALVRALWHAAHRRAFGKAQRGQRLVVAHDDQHVLQPGEPDGGDDAYRQVQLRAGGNRRDRADEESRRIDTIGPRGHDPGLRPSPARGWRRTPCAAPCRRRRRSRSRTPACAPPARRRPPGGRSATAPATPGGPARRRCAPRSPPAR